METTFWKNKKVVVTGGTGFIGSHLVDLMVSKGAAVTVVGRSQERMNKVFGSASDQFDFVEGDLRDPAFCKTLVKGQDAVMNLAAEVAGVGYNSTHPASIYTNNLAMTINVMDAAARSGDVERFLCVSSACIYQRHCTIPTPEEEGFIEDPEPTNFGYGWAKRAQEIQARCFAEEFDMKVAIARPYNGYGPRDDFEWETSHVIPALIRKAVEGQNPIEVWGDGSQTRSFLYVSDFVRGLMLTLQNYCEADAVNVGTDEETTIADLIKLIIKISNSDSEIYFDTSKPRGQGRRNGLFTKAKEKVKFEAEVPLEEGLTKTIEWYLQEREQLHAH